MKVKLLKTHTRPIAMYGVEIFNQNDTDLPKWNIRRLENKGKKSIAVPFESEHVVTMSVSFNYHNYERKWTN